jgi:lipopolysaccharide export system permease protein
VTLPSYVLRRVSLQILAALGILVAILQILELLDATTDILDRNLGLAGVAYYSVLHLPRLVVQAAPLSVLAGALFAFSALARDSAFVAMRAAGVSVYRIVVMALPAAFGVLLLHFVMSAWVAPEAEQAYERWWNTTTPPAEKVSPQPRSFRVGQEIVVASAGDQKGERLRDVTIYRRDAEGRLIQRLHAGSATYTRDGWRLQDVGFETPGPADVQFGSAPEGIWTERLSPGDVATLFAADGANGGGAAISAQQQRVAVRPPSYYRTQVQRTWAAPVAALVMLLLASPVVLANFRRGNGFVLTTASLCAGLLFLVLDGLLTAMGESGFVPALLAAWSAPAMFAAAGLTALLYLEEG